MKQALINFGLLILLVVIAFFLAIPIIRVYDLFFGVDWGGPIAYYSGVFLSLYFLFPVLFGYLYKTSYKTVLFIVISLPLLYAMFYFLFKGLRDGYLMLALVIAGYLLGFAIRKLVDHLRNRTAP